MDNQGIEYTDEEIAEIEKNESNNDEIQVLLQLKKEDELKDEVNQIYDNLQSKSSSINHEKTKSVDEIKNNFSLQKKGIDVFCNNSEADISIKKFIAKFIIIILAIQVTAIDVIFVFIGLGILKYTEFQLQLFVKSVFLEIGGLVGIIVSYIFKDNIKGVLNKLLNLGNKNSKK